MSTEYRGPYDAGNGHCHNGHPVNSHGRCEILNEDRRIVLYEAENNVGNGRAGAIIRWLLDNNINGCFNDPTMGSQ